VLPDVESIDKGVKVYYNFYTPAQEKQYWVIAIEIEKIN
jgi:ASC-1-like (ASCH) protein